MAEGSGGGAKAALLAALVVTAVVAVVVADVGTPAGASELATFSSCEELTAWMADAGGAGGRAGAAPRVVGEVKLPGFSSYLHPVAEGLVVGFGPDGDGQVAAKLFDVSDPTAPAVADSVALGQESAVAWDHHAFLALGDGRFAVPAITAWEPVESADCTPERRSALEQQAIALEQQLAEAGDQAQSDELIVELERLWSDPCLNTITRPVTTIVELQVAGGALQEVSRTEVRSQHPGERVLRFDDRWALWSDAELVVAPDAGGEVPVALT